MDRQSRKIGILLWVGLISLLVAFVASFLGYAYDRHFLGYGIAGMAIGVAWLAGGISAYLHHQVSGEWILPWGRRKQGGDP